MRFRENLRDIALFQYFSVDKASALWYKDEARPGSPVSDAMNVLRLFLFSEEEHVYYPFDQGAGRCGPQVVRS